MKFKFPSFEDHPMAYMLTGMFTPVILFALYFNGYFEFVGSVGRVDVFGIDNSVKQEWVYKSGAVCYVQKGPWRDQNVLHRNGTVNDDNGEYTWTLDTRTTKSSLTDEYWYKQNCIDPQEEDSVDPDKSSVGAQPQRDTN